MKRLFAILTVMAISLVAWGQELTVKDFHIDPSDISAVRYELHIKPTIHYPQRKKDKKEAKFWKELES